MLMRFLLILLVAGLSASNVCARELIANVQVDGKPALVFDDGFWRYDDAVGELCTPTQRHGAVCALPSVWSRLPETDESRSGRPEFVQGEYIADFMVFQHWGNAEIEESFVLRYIGLRTTHNGLKGSVLAREKGKIGGLDGMHIVVASQAGAVYAFTYANQNGRYLLAQTRDQGTTIYFSGHREAHQSFVDAVRPEPFEK